MNTGSAVQPAEEGFTPHGDGHPALADRVVRQAIRMAIDSQELVARVLLGDGEAGPTLVPPVSIAGARGEPPGDELMAFDLDAATQLLEDNGYRDTDGDGVREMPDGGRPLVFPGRNRRDPPRGPSGTKMAAKSPCRQRVHTNATARPLTESAMADGRSGSASSVNGISGIESTRNDGRCEENSGPA
jgi:hypothetical protein